MDISSQNIAAGTFPGGRFVIYSNKIPWTGEKIKPFLWLEGAEDMGKTVTEVVAALIWDGNRFLICQRPAQKARGLLWEFVGGKVEPGETKEQIGRASCRERVYVLV